MIKIHAYETDIYIKLQFQATAHTVYSSILSNFFHENHCTGLNKTTGKWWLAHQKQMWILKVMEK